MLGLRAVHYKFRSDLIDIEVDIFPMIHVGSASYYEEIKRKLDNYDFIIFEGVKSSRSRFITASYRYLTRSKRLGLVTQSKGLPLKQFKEKLIHGDVNTLEFDNNWKKIPFYQRVLILVISPLYGLYMMLTASRESISKNLEFDDLLSRREILKSDENYKELDNAIIHDRDYKLIGVLQETLKEKEGKEIKLSVIYGARHMRAITQFLIDKYNYKVKESNWLTVFNY